MLIALEETKVFVQIEPELSSWGSMAAAAQGEVFGQDITTWRNESRRSLELPVDIPIVIVGHQPEFFHPGILAKFIAGEQAANNIGGELVHLVVDHHAGVFNKIEFPEQLEEGLSVQESRLANLDVEIAMKSQERVTPPSNVHPFTDALTNAEGTNAAMQFASATDALMSPWATVDHLLGATSLLKTEFGLRVIEEMQIDPDRCRTTYNDAVSKHPRCSIASLAKDELPLWFGNRNKRFGSMDEEMHPRALLLTLLARVSIGDLFVHGTGGIAYDQIMEQWVSSWLGITPCPATMATATVQMKFQQQSIEDARKQYFSPEGESGKRKQFLDSIDNAPYRSSARREQFNALHEWLSSMRTRPVESQYRTTERIAARRDWAFPLYPDETLNQLRDAIVGT